MIVFVKGNPQKALPHPADVFFGDILLAYVPESLGKVPHPIGTERKDLLGYTAPEKYRLAGTQQEGKVGTCRHEIIPHVRKGPQA